MAPEHPLSLDQAAELLLSSMEAGEVAAMGVLIDHAAPEKVGGRVLFKAGMLFGSFQDPALDSGFEALARRGLEGDPGVLPGLHTLTLGGGMEARVYLELHHPPWELVIVGAGHLAQPLCTLGSLLGLEVTILDDRPEFATRERFPEADRVLRVDFSDPFREVGLNAWSHVLLVTRGHRYDYECLRRVLQQDPEPHYVGMIGSRRRVRATFQALLQEGVSPERIQRVRAPIGLDIGAETPAEIAVCVAAEMIQLWRGGSGRPLQEVERILDRMPVEPGGEPDQDSREG